MPKPSRRNFLRTTGCVAFAGFVLHARAAQATDSGGCRLGFGTYGLPGFTLEESIRFLAKTGFESIEIAAMPDYHGSPDRVPRARRPEIRKRLADSRLKLGALMGLPRPDGTRQVQDNDWVKKLLDLATDLAPDEPPIIQSVLGGDRWQTKKALFRDALGPWVELASDTGVTLAIKPHRGHAMSRPQQAVWLIEQLNATGKLRLVYDFSHYAYRDLSLNETMTTSLPHIGYLVMKDVVQVKGDVQFKLPGETGECPHPQILKLFYEGGYRGEVCCEVSSQVWRADDYDAKLAAQTCFLNLSQIFADAGLRSRD